MKIRTVLIGFQNSGKTSVGRLLAQQLKKLFIDTDACIAMEYKMSVREIYNLKGEEYFRAAEKKIITHLPTDESVVIATGGGSLLDEDNVALLKYNSIIIYLRASIATIKSRYRDNKNLPVFIKQIDELYKKRKNIYKNVADITIATDNRTRQMIADDIKLSICTKRGEMNG